MTRYKAATIHLITSLSIGIVAFSLLYFVYYPQPYFQVSGADQLVMILLAVDVILGPLLTLVVFKSGKWGMKFDIACIAAVQLAALSYGLFIMWQARPVFVVAVTERFNLVFAVDMKAEDFEGVAPEFQMPYFGPVVVGAVVPSDPDQKMKLLDSALMGRDIEFFPKYFVPYNAEFAKTFVTAGRPSAQLEAKGLPAGPSFKFLPLRGRFGDAAAEIGPDGKPIRAHLVDPW